MEEQLKTRFEPLSPVRGRRPARFRKLQRRLLSRLNSATSKLLRTFLTVSQSVSSFRSGFRRCGVQESRQLALPVTDVNDRKKDDMLQITMKVREHGARIMQGIPSGRGSRGIVISKELDSVLLKKKAIAQVDVLSPDWVLESIQRGCSLPFHKR